MFKFVTHRPLWVNVLAGIVLALLIFFIFVLSLNWCTHHNESRTVPAVLGKSLDEAEKILDKAGFEMVIQDSLYTDTTKPLTVLKQIPDADELVKINRKVFLTINRAVPPMVDMPNLVGISSRSAEMVLSNANLKLGDISYKTNFANDAVLEQWYNGDKIAPGTKLRMGSVISLVISKGMGDEQMAVPSLFGATFCEAKTYLKDHGIEIGSVVIKEGESIKDTCNAYIYRQSPERFDQDGKPIIIRSGQLMDVWLQEEKPEPPSNGPSPQPPTEN